MTRRGDRRRRIARFLLAAVYMAAGFLHLAMPEPFAGIVPPWVPFPQAIVVVTGLCEIAGAAGLLFRRTRALAGVLLSLYALCVYPANIMHAVHDLSTGTGLGWAYHYPRLFAQPFICWWALWVGDVTGRAGDRAD